jgi:hypothetical protein
MRAASFAALPFCQEVVYLHIIDPNRLACARPDCTHWRHPMLRIIRTLSSFALVAAFCALSMASNLLPWTAIQADVVEGDSEWAADESGSDLYLLTITIKQAAMDASADEDVYGSPDFGFVMKTPDTCEEMWVDDEDIEECRNGIGRDGFGEVSAWPVNENREALIDESEFVDYSHVFNRNDEGWAGPGDLYDTSECTRDADCVLRYGVGITAYPFVREAETGLSPPRAEALLFHYSVAPDLMWNDPDLEPPAIEDAIDVSFEFLERLSWEEVMGDGDGDGDAGSPAADGGDNDAGSPTDGGG